LGGGGDVAIDGTVIENGPDVGGIEGTGGVSRNRTERITQRRYDCSVGLLNCRRRHA
jgi:hypothetical protein